MNRTFRLVLFIAIVTLLALILKSLYYDTAFDGENPLSLNLLDSQTFNINSDSDTVLFGHDGTLVECRKGIFKDSAGFEIHGPVQIELIEIIHPEALVYSGLTTLSNSNILSSGGMIKISAHQNGNGLIIKEGEAIGIAIPTDKFDKDMRKFNGQIIDNSVNWIDPMPIMNFPDTLRYGEVPEEALDKYGWEDFPFDSFDEVVRIILPDSSEKKFYYDSLYADYISESRLTYVFESKNLGWLNIDRLLDITVTEEISLEVIVAESNLFQTVFVKLIIIDLKSIVAGHEKTNNSYVFGKLNSQEVNLPIGYNATILVTAYKDRKPYYGIYDFKIGENQIIELDMKKSSLKEIIKIIEERF